MAIDKAIGKNESKWYRDGLKSNQWSDHGNCQIEYWYLEAIKKWVV